MNIIQYVKSLFNRVKKSDVIEELEINDRIIREALLPMLLEEVEDVEKHGLRAPINQQLINSTRSWYRCGIDPCTEKTFFKDMVNVFKTIQDILDGLIPIAEKELADVNIRDGLSVKKANIIQISEYINFVVSYSLSLLEYISYQENEYIRSTVEEGYHPVPISKAETNYITSNLSNFLILMNEFKNFDMKTIENFDKLPDLVVDIRHPDMSLISRNSPKYQLIRAGLSENFTGNPAYHFGMMITEYQIKRYQIAKERKELLTLRLMDLKAMRNGESNPRLEKKIMTYEKMIKKLEYKIRKFEAGAM